MSTRISAGVDDLVSLLFITIDCKITKFSFTCLFTFCNNYNIGQLTSTTSKRKNDHEYYFCGHTPCTHKNSVSQSVSRKSVK